MDVAKSTSGDSNKQMNETKPSLYQVIWRWHFYAGVIVAPFLIILAVTGGIYLFKPQIEQTLYQQYYEVTPTGDRLSPDEQLEMVHEQYPDSVITAYRPGESSTRSSEVTLSTVNGPLTVFLDPYTGEQLGTLYSEDRIMNKIEEMHGELMAGTIGDRIVELAACWALVLIITGLYLWFPQKKKSFAGVLYPRWKKGKRAFRRDLHAVPAFWIGAGMFFLIITGLPWSGFWGQNFQSIATQSGVGYPPSVWVGSAPTSTVKTEDIADVPWAAEKLEVPTSNVQGFLPLAVEEVVTIANRVGMHPTYTIYLPREQDSVYTVSAYPPRAQDEATIHIDQYTGAVLADYRYDHYGSLAKAVALGITIHKGTQFGWMNQWISLLVCIGMIGVALSGYYLWWKRKPKQGLGAPKAPSVKKMKRFLFLLIVLGIIFPLVGLSLVVIWLLDRFVIRQIPAVKHFFNA
ncbi:PepSY domain-containing protein [Halalkalibacterium halodurans]|uniref:PepSY-associated TM helix domain-containing protein n=2 Tax=Halalkalibacterium halodurans TaxID=86665 RepID=UPI002E1A7765|nr:PepSY domain-containing protein [Halalkalibacterium halodurans]MED4083570.1 PepSY domain-containing protein [Halalkalibacterium halodurans]MED4105883.1 PepSY domain-containing protein [Halalkalibacterium halodurans]MED4109995.1 PepSY domain-containing protein [Halalkalibacterium halodurans]MED4125016.1 PepSY domain-containing protein [Halalkalibacterium halodurans]